jgi:DNA repair protein RadC
VPKITKNNAPHYLGHRQRLKIRFLENGINSLQPYEVIELFFTFVVPRQDVKKEAKEIIEKYGSVKNFFDADPKELSNIKFVKENATTLIKFIKEISLLYQKQQVELIPISISQAELNQYCINKLGFNKEEQFWVLCLNSKYALIGEYLISEGLADKAMVYPKQIIETALKHNAYSILLLHNHTNGNPQPSEQDITITKAIEIPAKLINISIYDHLIVAENKYYSFKENKLI